MFKMKITTYVLLCEDVIYVIFFSNKKDCRTFSGRVKLANNVLQKKSLKTQNNMKLHSIHHRQHRQK